MTPEEGTADRDRLAAALTEILADETGIYANVRLIARDALAAVPTCRCKPWQQSWHQDHPERCTTCCGLFVPYSRARECYSAAECGGTCAKHRVAAETKELS